MKVKCDIKNLDCANCAAKIERHLRSLPEVKEVSVNFATLSLHIDTENLDLVRKEIQKLEPEVEIVARNQNSDAPHADHHHGESENPRKSIYIMIASFALFLVQLVFEDSLHQTPWGIGEYLVAISAYLLAGWNVLRAAFSTIRKGRMFDENVLMTIATMGAFAIHAISEAVGVMIFYKIGEFLQELAVNRSRRSISALLEIRPDFANRKTENGIEKVSPEIVAPGELILVKAGEKIPLDGEVVEGSSQVNTAAITGESQPSMVQVGDSVLAGSINLTGLITCRVTKSFSESSIAKILDLVENATANKAKTEQFITRFARYYTPAVVFLSLSIAVVPPLLGAGAFHTWIYRALVLLVISCPCALMVSIPLGFFGGIGGASRKGILVKGANFLDALASVRTVVFDKTGTLTQGVFHVQEIITRNGFSKEQILHFASLAESHSNHPIAKSILLAAQEQISNWKPENIIEQQEISGFGVKVRTEIHSILVGNDALLHRENIEHDFCKAKGTVVFVAINECFAGSIVIGDRIKEDASIAIQHLQREGVDAIVMLTGDNQSSAQVIANAIGITRVHAGLLPEDKVQRLEEIYAERVHVGKVAFVGDGINDAPVLARADVGIAMGGLGSDAAIETADVVLMTDHPSKVAEAIRIGKRTRNIIWQNIVFALTVKIIFISFGAFGLAGMWEAVFADMGTALLAVLNSSRALRG